MQLARANHCRLGESIPYIFRSERMSFSNILFEQLP